MSFTRRWPAVCSLGLVVATVLRAQPPEPASPPIILPKMEVKATVPPAEKENWRYASFGNFEVLAKGSDLAAGGVLNGLQEFDYALRLVFPFMTAQPAQPVTILLTPEADYHDFVASPPPGEVPEFSRYFHGSERSVIVVDMDATAVTIDGDANEGNSVDPYRQLGRQYLRHVIAEKGAKLPGWLEEGLAQTITDIDFRGAWLTFGKLDTQQNLAAEADSDLSLPDFLASNPAISGLSFKQVFAHRKFLPLDQFFTVRLPDGSTPSSDSAWAKQAYAFVHFCLFGNQQRYRAPLQALLERLQNEPLSEGLFVRCFGVNYARMLTELRGYLLYTKEKYQRYELKPEERLKAGPVQLREAADEEIALLKGEALELSGHGAVAREFYRQAYLRGVRTPDYLAAYAAACYHGGEMDRARELNEAALAKGTLRPSAHVLQAQLRLDHYLAPPAAPDHRLNDAELAAVLSPLFAARQLTPPLPEVYLLIADAWSRSESPPKPENLAVLDEGIRYFPRQSVLLIRSIELYRRIGDNDKVTSIARLGLRMAADAAARAYFEPLAGTTAPPPR